MQSVYNELADYIVNVESGLNNRIDLTIEETNTRITSAENKAREYSDNVKAALEAQIAESEGKRELAIKELAGNVKDYMTESGDRVRVLDNRVIATDDWVSTDGGFKYEITDTAFNKNVFITAHINYGNNCNFIPEYRCPGDANGTDGKLIIFTSTRPSEVIDINNIITYIPKFQYICYYRIF